MVETDILAAAERLVRRLEAKSLRVATAESCTGGLLSGAITGVAGSSAVFEQGFVTYSNGAKHELLGVPDESLREYGAVSTQVARAMAQGLRDRTGADVALSVTGIAGPGGGSAEKPVGLVWFGVADRAGIHTEERRFGPLERNRIRALSVLAALELALSTIEG